jgi:hypothetical protein
MSFKPHRYFVNLPVDLAAIGGLSLLTFAGLFVLQRLSLHGGGRTDAVVSLGATLVWIVNYPHFSATSYRLYRSQANMDQYPLTSYVVPFLVLGGAALSMQAPGAFAPYFVKFFQIWSPYHFSGQSFGIAMIYARRAGVSFSRFERTVLKWFIFSTYLALIAVAETGIRSYQFFGVTYPALGLPPIVAQIAQWTVFGLGALMIVMLVVRPVLQRRTVAWMALVPAATQFVWFGLGQQLASFAEFIPAFHSVQYLLVAWSVQLKERLDEQQLQGSTRFVARESIRWVGSNLAGGFALFWGLPHAVAWIGGHDLGITTAIFFAAIQIHHFFVDGVIWKLKNPNVLSPLLVNIDDLRHPAVRLPARGSAALS